jgi:hypothetical protein
VPIIASIGTYDLGSLSADQVARLTIFVFVDVVIPVSYAFVLGVLFQTPAWRATFAEG